MFVTTSVRAPVHIACCFREMTRVVRIFMSSAWKTAMTSAFEGYSAFEYLLSTSRAEWQAQFCMMTSAFRPTMLNSDCGRFIGLPRLWYCGHPRTRQSCSEICAWYSKLGFLPEQELHRYIEDRDAQLHEDWPEQMLFVFKHEGDFLFLVHSGGDKSRCKADHASEFSWGALQTIMSARNSHPSNSFWRGQKLWFRMRMRSSSHGIFFVVVSKYPLYLDSDIMT